MGSVSTPDIAVDGLPVSVILSAFEMALDAALQFEGATAPNPPVGCVLLDREGAVIAVGAHARAGAPHAEADALAKARAMGRFGDIDTVIVTLEPCNHTGRTPPCTDAILSSAASRVVIGAGDPNPDVAGGGAKRLADAGLRVETIAKIGGDRGALLQKRARRLIAPFAKFKRTGLPFVTVKQALNAQGGMVPPKGQKTFTSDVSLDLAHRLRRRAGAILTGSGTVLADDPEFTVRRIPDFKNVSRKLVILDRRRRVSDAYLASARERGFDVEIAEDLTLALRSLGQSGVMEVLVEAGPQVTDLVLGSAFWDEHVVIRQTADGPDAVEVIENAQSSEVV